MGRSSEASLLLLALAFGCSSSASVGPDGGTDTDADSDTDTDTDTDTDIDIWEWSCSLPLDTTCDEFEEMPSAYDLQVNGAYFDDLTFVHASRSPMLILAERATDDGPEPVVVLRRSSPDEFVQVGVAPPPAEPLGAIDVASDQYLHFGADGLNAAAEVIGYHAVALLCGASSCALYGLAVDGNAEPIGLEAIPGGEVPLAESRAMTWIPPIAGDDVYLPGRACVAGDGIACFDEGEGIWSDMAIASGGVLNAIDVEFDEDGIPTWLWVAGEGGRIATNRDNEWTEIDSGSSTDLTAISAHDGVFAAGGAEGFVFGDGEHAIPCESESAYTAMFVHTLYSDDATFFSFTALAADHVVEIRAAAAGIDACAQPNDFAGTPRNADYRWDGADAIFGYALTTGGLYGRMEYYVGVD